MAKVIIGIHGRSNKPKKMTLQNWWKQSAEEGLKKNLDESLGNVEFEIAYYSDVYYNRQIPDSENEEPYIKAKAGELKRYKRGIVDRIRSVSGNWLDNPLDWLEENSNLFSSLAKKVTKKVMKDLGKYYNNPESREQIKKRLRDLLEERKDDEIILISHSMGTIVAYDVLRELGRSPDHKDVKIEHFITMGAPLGLTVVKGNIVGAASTKLRTPSCVTKSWVNFSDPDDYVALDSHLADDYDSNSFDVKVGDVLVCNEYKGKGKEKKPNPHKSYGYLRTPEFSGHLASLL